MACVVGLACAAAARAAEEIVVSDTDVVDLAIS
jgi:hypothetical protein